MSRLILLWAGRTLVFPMSRPGPSRGPWREPRVERAPDLWRSRLGQRVVVRRRLPDGSATDVVGPLVAVDKVSLTVAASAGTVTIPLADVVVGKVVPPRPARPAPPHRALTVADLEHVMALHWRAPVAEALGSWLLRSAEGFTHRANSVLAAGLPGLDLTDAVRRAQAWYSGRGRPARAGAPRPAPAAAADAELVAVAEAFAAGGWRVIPQRGPFAPPAATAALATAPADAPAHLHVRLDREPDAGWLALYRYRGEPLP